MFKQRHDHQSDQRIKLRCSGDTTTVVIYMDTNCFYVRNTTTEVINVLGDFLYSRCKL